MRAFTTFLILFFATAFFLDAKAEVLNISGYVIENDNSRPLNDHVLLVNIKSPNSPFIFQEKLYTNSQGFYSYTFKVPYAFGFVNISTIDCDNQVQTVSDYFSPLQPNVVGNFFICFEQGMTYCNADFIYSQNPQNETQVLFRQTSFGDNLQFNWDFGDSNISDLPNPVHVFAEAGFYEVCLEISDPAGNCVDVVCRSIEISQQTADCTADFVHLPVSGSPATYEFIDISSPEIVAWEWDFGDGTISKLQNPTHTFKSSGTFTVCLTIESAASGCSDNLCETITVDATGACFADFDYIIDPENPMSVTFGDISSGSPDSWSWNFGDGSTSALQLPTHEYSSPGLYEVCLTIQNSNTGCTHQSCKVILLLDEPFCNAYFSYYKLALDPVTIQFADMSLGNIISYQWDFGDGNTSSLPNPVHSFFETGTYQVCLSITGQDGCEDTFCNLIYADGSADCEAAYDYFINYENYKQIAFLDKSVGDNNQWLWDFGDGNFSSEKNPVHFFENDGIYLVCLTVSDATNPSCEDQICKYVYVSEDDFCKVQFTFLPNPGNPFEIQFANQSSGNLDYWIWDFGDDFYSNELSPLHEYAEEGEYRVCLMGIDLNSFCWDATCETIYVTNATQLTASFTHTISPENPFLVDFEDNSSGDVATWIWDFGDGNTSGQQNPQHTYQDEGTFEVCLTVINAQGNQSSTSCETLVIEAPDLCFADFDSEKVEDEILGYQFTDNSQGIANTWEWDFGDGNTSALQNPVHFYQDSGSYNVQLKIFHSDSLAFCSDSTQKEIFVFAPMPFCKADFSFYTDSSVNTPRHFHFQDMSENNPDEWFWEFGDGNTSNEQNPSHQYEEGGEYTVQLTVTKFNAFGTDCSDTKTLTITTPEYYHIGGFIYAGSYPINNPVHTGDTAQYYLYRHHGTDNIFCIDTAQFTTNGYYFALYLLEDQYLIKVRLTNNSTNARNYFPAYFGNILLWQDAPAYYLTQTHQYDLDIHLPPIAERPKGTGLISGNVQHHTSNKGNLPENDAQVLIFDAENSPIDYIFSDNEGNFNFESLELGSYKILAESTGLFTEPVFVTLTAENPEISDIQLTLYPFDITGIEDLSNAPTQHFNIYPNPVNDVLNIHVWNSEIVLNNYQVLSISGNLMMQGNLSQNENQEFYQINTTNLSKGAYILKLQPEGQSPAAILKFIK